MFFTKRFATAPIQAHVKWMTRRDMPEVLAIEHAACSPPLTEDQMRRILNQKNAIGMVAEHDNRIVGFMVYELHHGSVHIVDFAVLPAYQRAGVGRTMAEKLKAKLTPVTRDRIILHVRERGLGAQLFFRAMGFVATGTVRDFYSDTGEDAYLFLYVTHANINGRGSHD